MRKIKYAVLAFLLITGCKYQMKFDRELWLEDREQPQYREAMMKDLLTNYKVTGIKCSQLEELIGGGSIDTDKHILWYDVDLHYDWIDPDRGTTIEFYFNSDSIVTSYKIFKWKNRPEHSETEIFIDTKH